MAQRGWHTRRGSGPRRGQSMVELALMMPLLALVLLGTVDLARAFFYYTRLTNAVKEGAIYGAYQPWNQGTYDAGSGPLQTIGVKDVRDRAYAEADGRLGVPDTDVVITVSCYASTTSNNPAACKDATMQAGHAIEVSGQYRFRPMTPLISRIWNPLTMRKATRMAVLTGQAPPSGP